MRTLREMLAGGQGGKEKSSGHQTGSGVESACRCAEVSEMQPRQLFRLMLGDLAFWKKTVKNAPSGMQHQASEHPEGTGPARRTHG